MSRDKINEMIGNFSKKHGFATKLNNNMCNLMFNNNEKLNIEYIEDAERIIIYTYLMNNIQDTISQEQINLAMQLNGELFAKTGGMVILHPTEEVPILCWGSDVAVLREADFTNVLENIAELTILTREKLNIESTEKNKLKSSKINGIDISMNGKFTHSIH